MLIGLDFDNTLAGYDRAFALAARELAGAPADLATKTQVRAWLRGQGAEGETIWQRLQGQVYGARMNTAELIPGVGDFLRRARRDGARLAIVSHKTEYGHFDPARVNLRDAARNWMTAQGFFAADGFGLDPTAVYFEGARAEKLARIAALGCTHFVDDLEEVLGDPDFPPGVRRWLYVPGEGPTPQGPFTVRADWREIADDLLGAI